jgi:NodT family efflux transporter outer membrane factor (OMF) lipoprotein
MSEFASQRSVALALVAVLLAGCAVGPSHRPPEVAVEPKFREAPDSVPAVVPPAPAPVTPSAAAFWETLGDSTLDRLVAQGLEANYDIVAAAARVKGARAERTLAKLDLAPTITVAGGYTRQRLPNASFSVIGAALPDQDLWDVGAQAFWEIDLFGRLRRNLQGQSALLGSAQEDLRAVQILLTAELASAYFDLRGAQGQLGVAQRNAENQRRTFEVTQERLDAGRGTAFDSERARAQLNTTLAAIPVFEARVASAQYRIGVLVGRPPAAVAGELQSVAALPEPPAIEDVVTPDSLIRNRPDVLSAERRLAAETAFVGAAQADYLPRVTVGGQAGWTSLDLDNLGGTGTSRFAIGPVITWPALNLGRVKARADAARAREAEARARYEQSVLQALQEVETSLVTYRTALSRLGRLEEASAASERAADLARLRFEGGVTDFLQVLDAERTQLEAQDQLARSRTETVTAYVDLYRALGGTWPLSAN